MSSGETSSSSLPSNDEFAVEFWTDKDNVAEALQRFDPEQTAQLLQTAACIKRLEVENITGKAGGLSGEIFRMKLWTDIATGDDDEQPLSLILKLMKPSGGQTSTSLGLSREASFWCERKKLFGQKKESSNDFHWPAVYYASVDAATSRKAVLMEDLSTAPLKGVQAGRFFGAGSPLNWSHDLGEATALYPHVTERQIALKCFGAMAHYHALYWDNWKTTPLVKLPWVRGAGWAQGQDEADWQSSMNFTIEHWEKWMKKKQKAHKKQEEKEEFPSPLIVQLIEASLEQVKQRGFQGYVADMQRRPLTFIHGDFHPANCMVVNDTAADGFRLALLDWELVGIGSGPQEIAQFLISHSLPQNRREYEGEALQRYHDRLLSSLRERSVKREDEPSFETIKTEYVAGGIGKWIWLLPLLFNTTPRPVATYFHDQVKAFAEDHGVTADNVGMPRV